MRVVLDTNVVVSALNFPGNERLVLELALRGRFESYLSRFILEEVAGVLVRKFGWGEERTTEAVLVLDGRQRHRTPTAAGGDRRGPRRQPCVGLRGCSLCRLPDNR